jgi:thioredoxin-like negative regulator of GroEL
MFHRYLKYKIKYLEHKNYNLTGGGEKNKSLYLFKAEWCGHCTNFKQTWKQLKNEFKNEINFVKYDSNKHANIMKQYNIQGYPTLILKIDDKAIEYMGNRNIDDIKEFINKYK